MTKQAKNSAKPLKEARKLTPKRHSKDKIRNTVIWVIAAMLWVATAIIVSQLIVGLIMVQILGKEQFAEPLPTTIFSAVSYVLAFVLVAFVPPVVVINWRNIGKTNEERSKVSSGFASLKTLGIRGLPTWSDIGLSIVGLIAYFILAMIVMAFFQMFPWFNAGESQDIGFSYNLYGVERMLAFITLVVLAPVAEELIFRGWLYGKMRTKLSAATTNLMSVLISSFLVSLLFGAIHMQWNVGVNVFAMSLVACALREYTGTIYAGILLHMLKNGLAFYALFVLGMS